MASTDTKNNQEYKRITPSQEDMWTVTRMAGLITAVHDGQTLFNAEGDMEQDQTQRENIALAIQTFYDSTKDIVMTDRMQTRMAGIQAQGRDSAELIDQVNAEMQAMGKPSPYQGLEQTDITEELEARSLATVRKLAHALNTNGALYGTALNVEGYKLYNSRDEAATCTEPDLAEHAGSGCYGSRTQIMGRDIYTGKDAYEFLQGVAAAMEPRNVEHWLQELNALPPSRVSEISVYQTEATELEPALKEMASGQVDFELG